MTIIFVSFIAVSVFAAVTNATEDQDCSSPITRALKRACPDGLRDDGTSCWRDTYGRGVGRAPDKAPCRSGQRDDGTSCWVDSYGRGGGRPADKSPCPSGLRDDGTSCWNDAHIYGKGCCCTLWGCCNRCRSGYHDDGCTCRKTNVGIRVNLFQRLGCRGDEDKYGSRCYPKCREGYRAVGCCLCEPNGGPRIVTHLGQRQSCRSGEEKHGSLCYPRCKSGYRAVGCCLCEPNNGPGIEVTLFDRQYCEGSYIMILGFCQDLINCSRNELLRRLEGMMEMTSELRSQFNTIYRNNMNDVTDVGAQELVQHYLPQ